MKVNRLPVLSQRLSPQQVRTYRIIPYEQLPTALLCYIDREVPIHQRKAWEVIIGSPLSFKRLDSKLFQTLLSQHFYDSAQTNALDTTSDVLEQMLSLALSLDSSDIHFEVYETRTRIRFRLDGKLKAFFDVPLKEYPTLINKIKIKAQMDIAEKRLPQDGRIRWKNKSETLDLRVSSLPTLYGEKLVLRLLRQHKKLLQIKEVGFSKSQLKHYQNALKNTQGLIVISGPTGSGKTTTLYATLQSLNDPTRHILTIEDPIEYTLDGINQVQLKASIGLSFPRALRTFLRQDPDVIMLGEIRDEATAQMAVRAAQTGHLVLATLHTTSAWGIFSRLVNMGIPPYILAETLRLSVAQRLVRKLCVHCKTPLKDLPPSFAFPKTLKILWVPKGCPQCYHTGYLGRMALYELLPTSAAVLKAFQKDQSARQYRKENPYKTLKNQALKCLEKGETSLEEVYPLIAFES